MLKNKMTLSLSVLLAMSIKQVHWVVAIPLLISSLILNQAVAQNAFQCGPNMYTYLATSGYGGHWGIRCVVFNNITFYNGSKIPSFSWYGEGTHYSGGATYRHVGVAYLTNSEKTFTGYASDTFGSEENAYATFMGNINFTILDYPSLNQIFVAGGWQETWTCQTSPINYKALPPAKTCGKHFVEYRATPISAANTLPDALRCVLKLPFEPNVTVWYGTGPWPNSGNVLYSHLGVLASNGYGATDICDSKLGTKCDFYQTGSLLLTKGSQDDYFVKGAWNERWCLPGVNCTNVTLQTPTIPPTPRPILAPEPTASPAPVCKTIPASRPKPSTANFWQRERYDVSFRVYGSGWQRSDLVRFQSVGQRIREVIVYGQQARSSFLYRKPRGCRLPLAIDDIVACSEANTIDGVGKVIATTSIIYTRNNGGLPILSYMKVDKADLPSTRKNGGLYSLLLHQTLHMLGVGNLWKRKGLVSSAAGQCTYLGKNGNSEFRSVSGCKTDTLPLKVDDFQEQSCINFDNECFNGEIMNMYTNSAGEFHLTRLTIAALQDLGYKVSYSKAEPYGDNYISPSCVCNACEQRRLRIVKAIDFDTSITNSTSWTKRMLSDDGFNKAQEYGKKVLLARRKVTMKLAMSTKHQKMNMSAVYVGDDFMSVLYQDGDNGIFEVIVTNDAL